MKLVRYTALGFVVVSLALLMVSLSMPKAYNAQRSVTIEAPVPVVFELVNDLKKTRQWSPWFEGDDSLEVKWGETTRGAGASYEWTSESQSGGSFTMTHSEPNRRVVNRLAFGDDGEATAEWTFEALPGGTKVTWEFGGEAQGVMGGFTAAMIESVVVPQFEIGLQSLKALAEGTAPTEG